MSFLQSAVFGFLEEPKETSNATNHILLIFKIFLFKNRSLKPTITMLLAKLKNIVKIEGQLCFTERQSIMYNQKWGKILNCF